MSRETATELAAYAAYGRMVCEALPVDEEAQRRADRVLAERSARLASPRKLIKRRSP